MASPDLELLANAVSRLLGWTYFLCWSASFYPQPILNYHRRSTHGLAIDFPTINVLGFACYTISTSCFLFSPLIRRQYAERNTLSPRPTVRFNDLAFAAHGFVMTLIAYSQFWSVLWGFKVGGRQRVSKPVAGIFCGCLLAVIVVIMTVVAKGTDAGANASGWAWIDVIYAIGYVKLVCTVVKYIPQVWVNYKRQSTVGWSIYAILLDISGGLLSISQLVLDTSLQDDWSGLTGNPVKLGLGNISIVFDVMFIVQHYWLYRNTQGGKDEEREDGADRPLLGPGDTQPAPAAAVLKLATDTYDSDEGLNRSPLLQPIKVDYQPEISPPPSLPPEASAPSPEHVSYSPSKSRRRRSNRQRKTRPSQGDAVLISVLGPSYPDIASEAGRRPLNSASQSEASSSDQEMEEREDAPATSTSVQAADAALRLLEGDPESVDGPSRIVNGTSDKTQLPLSSSGDHSRTAKRHAQNGSTGKTFNDPLDDESAMVIDAKDSDAAVDGLLRLKESSPKTGHSPSGMRSASNGFGSNGSLATSPNLRQYTIPVSEGSPMETLPAMQLSPSHSLSVKSPNGERSLPSIVSQLGQLADHPAKDQESLTKGMLCHSRQSFSSASGGPGHSPPMSSSGPERRLPGQYISTQQRQSGPYQGQYPPTQASPASVYSETSPPQPYGQSQDPASMSPPGKPGYHPYYPNRRASQNDEHGPPYAAPAAKYTPTSGDGNPSSEGYTPSTDATLNEHRMSIDGARPLPDFPAPLPNGPLVSGGFKCDYPGCLAPPFQTQYLLNSHANVHSQNRPHYCPVKGCPRAEGGKGFKRKNEMIRHGLVHDSPGYVCPFCPDREHKYPRPDNLQRHVRVNHVDKDKGDIQLREVLAQRPEGGNRGRRRRLGG